MNPAEFCRDLETYLCRKNDGHLIRIVGPVFEQVCGWAAQGVPIKIAYRGIDRYFERQRAPGRPVTAARRRPVRIEFCEADILDAFDEWRRAIGVSAGAAAEMNGGAPRAESAPDIAPANASPASPTESAPREKASPALLTHIDRVMARLTQRRVDGGTSPALAAAVDRALGELDTMRAGARGARGEARRTLLDRLSAIDRLLIDAARGALDAPTLKELRGEAGRDLEPFRSRLSADAFGTAVDAALDRLVRDRCRLPSVRIDA